MVLNPLHSFGVVIGSYPRGCNHLPARVKIVDANGGKHDRDRDESPHPFAFRALRILAPPLLHYLRLTFRPCVPYGGEGKRCKKYREWRPVFREAAGAQGNEQ